MMRIIFLRHGETSWNRENRVQGRQDVPLNQNGIYQIQQIAKHFLHNQIRFSKICTSPLIRAKQSAEICSQILGVPIEIEPKFQERGFGELEGKTMEFIEKRYFVNCEEITDSPYSVESQKEVRQRVSEGLHKLINNSGENKEILVITHGSIIKQVGKIYGTDVGIIKNGTFIELLSEGQEIRLLY